MTRLHQEAKSDLLIAVKQNDRLSPAYCALIAIEMTSGNIDAINKILRSAVRSIPETYYIRYKYLTALQPRWGGSYELMQKYVNTIDKEALINPRIWTLKAEVSAERGYTAALNKDPNRAIQYYTEALSYGDRMLFLKHRGCLYMEVNQYELALNDFKRYRKYDEADKEVNGYIAYLNGELERNSLHKR